MLLLRDQAKTRRILTQTYRDALADIGLLDEVGLADIEDAYRNAETPQPVARTVSAIRTQLEILAESASRILVLQGKSYRL